VQQICGIERPGVLVPKTDLARSVSRQMHHLEIEASDFESVSILDCPIDFDCEVPILPDYLRV
jgi:hypothetical protein